MLRLNVIALKTSVLRFSRGNFCWSEKFGADQVPRVNHFFYWNILYLHSVWELQVCTCCLQRGITRRRTAWSVVGLPAEPCRAEEARQMGGEPWNASGSSKLLKVPFSQFLPPWNWLSCSRFWGISLLGRPPIKPMRFYLAFAWAGALSLLAFLAQANQMFLAWWSQWNLRPFSLPIPLQCLIADLPVFRAVASNGMSCPSGTQYEGNGVCVVRWAGPRSFPWR